MFNDRTMKLGRNIWATAKAAMGNVPSILTPIAPPPTAPTAPTPFLTGAPIGPTFGNSLIDYARNAATPVAPGTGVLDVEHRAQERANTGVIGSFAQSRNMSQVALSTNFPSEYNNLPLADRSALSSTDRANALAKSSQALHKNITGETYGVPGSGIAPAVGAKPGDSLFTGNLIDRWAGGDETSALDRQNARTSATFARQLNQPMTQ